MEKAEVSCVANLVIGLLVMYRRRVLLYPAQVSIFHKRKEVGVCLSHSLDELSYDP